MKTVLWFLLAMAGFSLAGLVYYLHGPYAGFCTLLLIIISLSKGVNEMRKGK